MKDQLLLADAPLRSTFSTKLLLEKSLLFSHDYFKNGGTRFTHSWCKQSLPYNMRVSINIPDCYANERINVCL